MNATSSDGSYLKCNAFGSYHHLMNECPYSWESLKVPSSPTAKVLMSEDTYERVCLFTGYRVDDILQLGVESRNCAVLDSVCTSSVCGEKK